MNDYILQVPRLKKLFVGLEHAKIESRLSTNPGLESGTSYPRRPDPQICTMRICWEQPDHRAIIWQTQLPGRPPQRHLFLGVPLSQQRGSDERSERSADRGWLVTSPISLISRSVYEEERRSSRRSRSCGALVGRTYPPGAGPCCACILRYEQPKSKPWTVKAKHHELVFSLGVRRTEKRPCCCADVRIFFEQPLEISDQGKKILDSGRDSRFNGRLPYLRLAETRP